MKQPEAYKLFEQIRTALYVDFKNRTEEGATVELLGKCSTYAKGCHYCIIVVETKRSDVFEVPLFGLVKNVEATKTGLKVYDVSMDGWQKVVGIKFNFPGKKDVFQIIIRFEVVD